MTMQPSKKFKKGDTVMVIAGQDKGKTGKILSVLRKQNRVVVEGVKVSTRHKKPTQFDEGGIVNEEGAIHISNIAHLDPKDKKPTRAGFKIENGEKTRIARRSGQALSE